MKTIPANFGQTPTNLVTGDTVNVAVPVYTGSRTSPSFSHYEFYYNCQIVKDSYDASAKHWFYFKNAEMSKAKKMQGKNFYQNARIVENAIDKVEKTAVKTLEKQLLETQIGQKKF